MLIRGIIRYHTGLILAGKGGNMLQRKLFASLQWLLDAE